MEPMEPMEPVAKRARTEPKGIQESDVGITCYISPEIPGFTGILKARYADFQVNEISNGEVIHLKQAPVSEKKEPELKKDEKTNIETSQEPVGQGMGQTAPVVTAENLGELNKSLGQETVEKITEIFSDPAKRVESVNSYADKQERTTLHRLVSTAYNSQIETETLPDNRILFKIASKRGQRKPRIKTKGQGEFVRFAVYKENKETMEVASLLAKLLRIPPKSIAFAGTKDRRGATTQLMSVKNISVSRLESLNYGLRNVKIGNYHHSKEPLRLGDLDGNEFFIALRNVNSYDNVDAALDTLKTIGFINYFGLQRFGTFSVSTHAVGKMILGGDFEGAVAAILQPQELSSQESAEARAAWQAKDIKKAFELMPRRCNAEHAILSALQESSSWINAILRIPRNLKLMYVHAYQSYIWNLAASERIKSQGLEIKQGDLVLAESDDSFQRARPVTTEEITSGAKTIYNVVLPTPGFDIIYPENLKSFYEETMKKDSIDCHSMRRNAREFSLPGAYRHIVAKPDNVEWWRSSYTEDEDPIILTDIEADIDNKIVKSEGPKRALVIKMSLGASQYATMALREVMKTDTSRHGELFFG